MGGPPFLLPRRLRQTTFTILPAASNSSCAPQCFLLTIGADAYHVGASAPLQYTNELDIPMARRSKNTPTTEERICEALRLGATYKLAAMAGGISYETLNNWLRAAEAGDE